MLGLAGILWLVPLGFSSHRTPSLLCRGVPRVCAPRQCLVGRDLFACEIDRLLMVFSCFDLTLVLKLPAVQLKRLSRFLGVVSVFVEDPRQ